MEKVNSEDKYLNDPLVTAQLEKLTLEIEQLRAKNRWEATFASYTPLLSVLIAVAGFLFGIYQFQKQQGIQQGQIIIEQQKERQTRELEQTIRIQNQIRSDIDQILQFTNDKQQTVSRIQFLLEDLKTFLDINLDTRQPTSSQISTRRITATFVKSVVDDCDFDQHRDINYAFTLISHWDGYSQYLKEDTQSLEYILKKYNEALEHVHMEDSSVIESTQFVEQLHDYPRGYGKLSTSRIFHFQDIILGFYAHLKLLDNEKAKEKHIKDFQQASCNATLTEQLFGIKFDYKSDPAFFSYCRRK